MNTPTVRAPKPYVPASTIMCRVPDLLQRGVLDADAASCCSCPIAFPNFLKACKDTSPGSSPRSPKSPKQIAEAADRTAHTSGIGALIEVIADAALQICLFQVETTDNELNSTDVTTFVRELLNPHQSQPLTLGPIAQTTAIVALSKVAKSKSKQWTETEEAVNHARMTASIVKLDDALISIPQHVALLDLDPLDKATKADLLWACRTALQETVTLLQMSDRYDIRKIVRAAKACAIENDRIAALASPDTLNDVVRAYYAATVHLAKLVAARSKYIADPVLRERLERGNALLQTMPEKLAQYTVAAFEGKEPRAQLSRRNAHDQIKATIDELATLVKRSSQELFAGVDLELAPLEEDKEDEGEGSKRSWRLSLGSTGN